MRNTGVSSRPEWTAAIQAELPDPVVRAGVLLDLFGKGVGDWNGYPSWEAVPEQLLAAMPIPVLLDAIGDTAGADRLEGAVRLFCSWSFRGRLEELRRELPGALRQRLLGHATTMIREDNRTSAMAVLGEQAKPRRRR
jgi:hypothetical protein